MNNNTAQKVEKLNTDGYQLDITDILSTAYNLYKKVALHAILGLLIYSSISWLINILTENLFGISIASISEQIIQNPSNASGIYKNILGSDSFFKLQIVNIILTCGLAPILAGIVYLNYTADHDLPMDITDLFRYYKTSQMKDLIIYTLIYLGLLSLGFMFCFAPGFYLLIGYIIGAPFIIFANAQPWEALEASRKVITKNWLTVFVIMIATAIVAISGSMLCGIGIVLTAPFVFTVQYVLYKKIIGFEQQPLLD